MNVFSEGQKRAARLEPSRGSLRSSSGNFVQNGDLGGALRFGAHEVVDILRGFVEAVLGNDVIALEHEGGFMPADRHRDVLRDACFNYVATQTGNRAEQSQSVIRENVPFLTGESRILEL